MATTESRNLPHLLKQAEAAYRSQATLAAADSRALARRAGHLSSFVRLSLDEPEVMRHMQAAAGDLRDCSRLEALLPKILDGALSLTGADFGNVQLLEPVSGALMIVAQSGFGSEFTEYFAVVDDARSACGRAARDCAQTVIADVTIDPGFAPHREIAAAAGFRAVQSTPLADSDGRLVGMVSTHFRQPGRLADRELRTLELFGDLAGEAVARCLGPVASDGGASLAGSDRDVARPRLEDRLGLPDTAFVEFAGEVVRRLFAAGLSLASAQAIIGDGAAGDRVAAAVDELDRAIRDVRTMVFDHSGRPVPRIDPGR